MGLHHLMGLATASVGPVFFVGGAGWYKYSYPPNYNFHEEGTAWTLGLGLAGRVARRVRVYGEYRITLDRPSAGSDGEGGAIGALHLGVGYSF